MNDLYEELNTTDGYIKYHSEEMFPNLLIVIDGVSLKQALGEFSERFFRIASRVPSLVCSRCSPTQKEQITEHLKLFTEKRILGIGDGGNDVGMIQAADVGIGIYGKEGIQAALASDFSITEFKNLNTLLLWHGRLSYKRSCVLSQFIIHRGIIISIMQGIFCAIFFFVAIPIFNGLLMLGYSTVFTLLPVFSLIFDEDISREVAYKYPILYRKVQAGTELNWYTFLYWIFISLYQGAIIMILIVVFFKYSSFYLVTTISFTCLIFIEFLNVFFSIHRLHIIQIISTVASVVIYILSLVLMHGVLNANELITTQALLLTLVIVLVSWLPPFLHKIIQRYVSPTD
jgi:phospholipid-translocating ATPase